MKTVNKIELSGSVCGVKGDVKHMYISLAVTRGKNADFHVIIVKGIKFEIKGVVVQQSVNGQFSINVYDPESNLNAFLRIKAGNKLVEAADNYLQKAKVVIVNGIIRVDAQGIYIKAKEILFTI